MSQGMSFGQARSRIVQEAAGSRRQSHQFIDDEITLALNLHDAAVMRYGRWKLPRVLRTDAAAVLGRMAY